MKGEKLLISIVVPCYNEEEVIAETITQLSALCDSQLQYDFELIFVDDGSKDDTKNLLCAAALRDSRVKIVGFSRNFGHQIAVTAGVDATTGEAVVLIDADLQDPPTVIVEMIKQWRNGFDVIYGTRTLRPGESGFKKITAQAFYRLFNRVSEVPIPLDTGDFRLMGRNVVNILKTMPERDRFVRGMVSWVGFNQLALPYQRAERFAGETKYPLRKMVRFASDGILSFSAKPLRLATWMGFSAAVLALLGIVVVLAMRVLTSTWVPGWTAIMIALLFLGAAQLISLGILGEYIGRIYGEAKQRPLYVVRDRIGFSSDITLEATSGCARSLTAQ